MNARKRVLLIGDSIRIGYAPLVTAALADVADVLQVKGNGQDSNHVRKHLKKWLKDASGETLDVIHFNCGLHDIKRKFGSTKHQQPIEKYKENLHRIINALKACTKAKLIWATTTPVIYSRHHATKGFDRFEEDVDAYNEAALAIMTEQGIVIDDLHRIIASNDPPSCIREDGVHMTDRGYEILASAVSAALRGQLARQAPISSASSVG